MSETQGEEPALARWPVFLAGAGFGLLAAYLLDPEHGPKRRTHVRTKGSHFGRRAMRLAGRRWRSFTHRLNDFYHETTSLVAASAPAEDAQLVERVRGEFGRTMGFAQAIRVDASGGVVTLSGPILGDNVSNLISTVRAMPGVRDVVDHLDRQDREQHPHH